MHSDQPDGNISPPCMPLELLHGAAERQDHITYGRIIGHQRIDFRRVDDRYKQTAAINSKRLRVRNGMILGPCIGECILAPWGVVSELQDILYYSDMWMSSNESGDDWLLTGGAYQAWKFTYPG